MKHIFVIAAVLSLLIACSSNEGAQKVEPNTLQSLLTDEPVDVEMLWQNNSSKGFSDYFNKVMMDADTDNIYITDTRRQLLAINKRSGRLVWKHTLPNVVSGGFTIGYPYLYFGDLEGKLHKFDLVKQLFVWSIQESSEIIAAPAINGDVIAFQTIDGKLSLSNIETGKKIWTHGINTPSLTVRGTGSPVIASPFVFAGFSTGKLVAFDLESGAIRWERRISVPTVSSEIERLGDVDATPLVMRDAIIANSFQGRTLALNPVNGNVYWVKDMSSILPALADYNAVYVVDNNSVIYGLDKRSGTENWKNEQFLGRKLSEPVLFDGYLVVGDYEGYVHFVSVETGEAVGRISVATLNKEKWSPARKIQFMYHTNDGDGEIASTPFVTENKLYILDTTGKLTALHIPEED